MKTLAIVLKKTTFYALQSSYLIPVIDAAYKEHQENNARSLAYAKHEEFGSKTQ